MQWGRVAIKLNNGNNFAPSWGCGAGTMELEIVPRQNKTCIGSGVVFDSGEYDSMIVYKLDEQGNAVQEENLQEWARWYCDHKDELVLAITDIPSKRKKIAATVVTRFRGQVGPMADPARPLVWITEATDGSYFGSSETKAEARSNHERFVRMLRDCYK